MLTSLLSLLFALAIVFAAAQLFSNALEYLGEKMGVSEGVTGSVFAAVGTAMPETIIPMIAILMGGAAAEVNRDVGVGAILGAPFMLGTLSLGLMAFFAGRKRGFNARMNPERSGLRRDLGLFFTGYTLVALTALLPHEWQQARYVVALVLFMLYFFYLLDTFRASSDLVDAGHATEAEEGLLAARLFGEARWVLALQLAVGLGLLVWGARLFVHGAEEVSAFLGIPVLVVSLLIIPVATELPEKINSIMWIRRGKDTLAFGNITGAMAFQGTVIPGAAMLLIPWQIDLQSFAGLSIVLAMMGAGWLWFLKRAGDLSPRALLLGIILYSAFLTSVAFAS